MAPFFAAQANLSCLAKTTTERDLYKIAVSDGDHEIASAGFGEDRRGQQVALVICNHMATDISCVPSTAKQGFDLVRTTRDESSEQIVVLNSNVPFYQSEELCLHAGARYIANELKKLSNGSAKAETKADKTLRAVLSLNHPACKS